MDFVNLKIRVKKYPKGWVVETQKSKWYGKKYWMHIISTAGVESLPWHFSSKEFAISEAQSLFIYDLSNCDS